MKKSIIFGMYILLLIVIAIYVFQILPSQRNLASVRNMEIEDVNLEEVNDGVYKGDYDYGSYTYKVEVKVKNHEIKEVDIISNRNTSHAKKAEEIIPKVIEKQSLDVDAVTGATTTSKALLKAIENALTSTLIE